MDFTLLQQRAIEIREKYDAFNKKETGSAWSNSQIMEGFVGDIGTLMKLVMAKEGTRHIDDVDTKLIHELSDCLWCLLVLADKYKVNLEESFMQTMDKLEKQIADELKKTEDI